VQPARRLSLANAKLGAVHGLAGVIGGTIEIPHGAACAALLLATIEANVKALRTRQPDGDALARYEQVARLLTGRVDATIEQGAVWIEETVRLLGTAKLASYGLVPDQVDESSQERSSRAAPRATRSNCAPKSCVAC